MKPTIILIIIAVTLSCFLWDVPQPAADPPAMVQGGDFLRYEAERYQRVEELRRLEFSKNAPGQDEFDAAHYRIELTFDPGAETIAGTVTAKLTTTVAAISRVDLDLADDLTVTQVREDGSATTFTHANNILSVSLGQIYALGDTICIEVDYGGQPGSFNTAVNIDALNFQRRGLQGSGPMVIFSISEPYFARGWWPCKDVPSDKATSDMFATVPDTMVCASNGTLVNEVDLGNGWKRYEWRESYPIATYLVSVAISNYAVFNDYYNHAPNDSMPVTFFAYPDRLTEAQQDFAVVEQMLQYYSGSFGQYPFLAEKYGMAMVPWGGALEHQTCTSYGGGLVRGDNRNDWVIAHELAHQWWGDLITPADWPEIWLNEAFATFSEALWFGSIGGFDAYRDWIRQPLRRVEYTGTLYDPPILFDVPNVYWRGAWVLHMLRGVMGETTFFAALADYATDARFVYGDADTDDFIEICETAQGADLDYFFDQFVYGWSEPSYEYSWVANGTAVEVRLRQVQESGLVTMPVQIRFSMAGGDSTMTAWNNMAAQSFKFDLPQNVTAVTLDPEEWILRTISEVPLDGMANASVQPNPFNATTTVSFETALAGAFDITIYDVSGAKIRDLAAGQVQPGFHPFVWDGLNGAGQSVSSGVYFVRLNTPQGQALARAVLLK